MAAQLLGPYQVHAAEFVWTGTEVGDRSEILVV